MSQPLKVTGPGVDAPWWRKSDRGDYLALARNFSHQFFRRKYCANSHQDSQPDLLLLVTESVLYCGVVDRGRRQALDRKAENSPTITCSVEVATPPKDAKREGLAPLTPQQSAFKEGDRVGLQRVRVPPPVPGRSIHRDSVFRCEADGKQASSAANKGRDRKARRSGTNANAAATLLPHFQAHYPKREIMAAPTVTPGNAVSDIERPAGPLPPISQGFSRA